MNDDEPMAQVVQELDVSDTLLTLKKMNKKLSNGRTAQFLGMSNLI